ncbi:protein kinase [Allostreptomyces psammosilenae]|uniref:Serine/threonine protein kinase n=1 Tax=Allostreptomyces psammosilenae TaxID=1892865 RepID=A0A852ZYK5_9ACTN|nr:protein kinase [Allostreptomyces psammosilenae]NYI06897.1 serine/threonine protein kinase [Allostreptomyces psammosilenae]
MTELPPYDLPPHVAAFLSPTSTRLVLHRRGSTVWDVRSAAGRYALKLGFPASPTHEWTALAPAREVSVLRALGRGDVFEGRWDRGTWGVQPWRTGESLWDRWAPVRESATPPPLADAAACAAALAELHARGWAHGDVQPAHLLVLATRADLIDLALALGGDIPPEVDFPFRGCLVHYEAPELSRSVLDTGHAVPTPEADVYALGASLLISATGRRAVVYPDDAPRVEQRQAIVEGRYRDVTVPGPLGPLVDAMLSPKPGDRPTAGEVHAAMATMPG